MAFEILRPQTTGLYVILCDHASNFVPAELNQLGLSADQLAGHIAWDIGAAGVATELSRVLESPAVLSGASRLVIDCNRHLTAADLIPPQSDDVLIPGNANLSSEQKAGRIARWFDPYHAAVEEVLTERAEQGVSPIVLSIHSMTPSLGGVERPWQIALSSHDDRSLAEPLLAALREPEDIVVGDNEPYDLDPAVDFSVPFHALRRKLRHLQVEFRQDEVATPEAQAAWAQRFAAALAAALLR